MGTRRLLGIDRSGPPPPETLPGRPLNPWTVPNAIGFVRLALIPVFAAVALSSRHGRAAPAAVLFAVIGGSDYLDGVVARATGQYSRLGVLMDPLTDRLLVAAGVVVCWSFDLLPRWALAVLLGRELVMLAATQFGLSRGIDLRVSMLGRLAVWPTMLSLFLAMVVAIWVSEALLYVGLAGALAASARYIADGVVALRERPSSSA
ncbi:MAG: CDP-alcohol phosphatidyltransferase family protein [Actinobacteria bacterium]|nr:CDP-alcohol phosphatidyltransferase family protein [Actinomycetota bacterium]